MLLALKVGFYWK